jgi:HK97 family phage portal protein
MAGETRSSIEDPRVPVSAANFYEFFGLGSLGLSASGVRVTIDSALGVPAVWGAVNFLSATLAGFPLHVYRDGSEGAEKVTGDIARMLNEAPNDELTSYQWRKNMWSQVFTGGRAFTFIERSAAGAAKQLWELDPNNMQVRRVNGRRVYHYRDGDRNYQYESRDIIDIPFTLKANGVDHRGPIASNKDVIGLAIAATQYASKFFQGGGVPPFAITGNFVSSGSMQRAAEDLSEAVKKAAKEQRQALVLPSGLEIKPIGADPDKAQLIEAHRFIIEQIARIYSLPPLFLQDLSKLSYSNAEQQDLHLAKHTLTGWQKQFEEELNLKLFGRTSSARYVKGNMDALLRGDFKTRMEGHARAIQAGVSTPNEARSLENRKNLPGGDKLFMQGAMLPIESLGAAQQQELPLAGGKENSQ